MVISPHTLIFVELLADFNVIDRAIFSDKVALMALDEVINSDDDDDEMLSPKLRNIRNVYKVYNEDPNVARFLLAVLLC